MDIKQQSFNNDIIIEKNDDIKNNLLSKRFNLDDCIYNNLSSLVNPEEENKITDLLNIFYYFIICYSKMCFKKNANWDKKYKYFTHHISKKKYIMKNTFDYTLANDLKSNAILLEIQKQLYSYRKQYKEFKETLDLSKIKKNNKQKFIGAEFFTDEKKQEILDFINESLYDFVKFIAPPVKFISEDIKQKINKYNNIKSKTRSNFESKYDSDALKTIIQNTNIYNNNNVFEFSFTLVPK
jgi:hypothetical protein